MTNQNRSEVTVPEKIPEGKKEYDLYGLICPLSKIQATAAIDTLDDGDTARIILGDTDSLKSVAQELKDRGMKPDFAQESENRFVLTITK